MNLQLSTQLKQQLTLTPALCATMLKPIAKGHAHDKKTGLLGPFYNWFNRKFEAGTKRYSAALSGVVKRSVQAFIIYLLVIAGVVIALVWMGVSEHGHA